MFKIIIIIIIKKKLKKKKKEKKALWTKVKWLNVLELVYNYLIFVKKKNYGPWRKKKKYFRFHLITIWFKKIKIKIYGPELND